MLTTEARTAEESSGTVIRVGTKACVRRLGEHMRLRIPSTSLCPMTNLKIRTIKQTGADVANARGCSGTVALTRVLALWEEAMIRREAMIPLPR